MARVHYTQVVFPPLQNNNDGMAMVFLASLRNPLNDECLISKIWLSYLYMQPLSTLKLLELFLHLPLDAFVGFQHVD